MAYLRRMCHSCALLELRKGFKLDACVQVTWGLVDNYRVGGAEECVSLLGDVLNAGGFCVVGRLTQGQYCKFHKVFL